MTDLDAISQIFSVNGTQFNYQTVASIVTSKTHFFLQLISRLGNILQKINTSDAENAEGLNTCFQL